MAGQRDLGAPPIRDELAKLGIQSEIAEGESLPRLAYSVRDCAAMLNVSEKTIRRLIQRGLIRPSKAIRHILISKQEIERFLRETQRGTAPTEGR